jgi:hypothetical protein
MVVTLTYLALEAIVHTSVLQWKSNILHLLLNIEGNTVQYFVRHIVLQGCGTFRRAASNHHADLAMVPVSDP